jgi:hypothetical protein
MFIEGAEVPIHLEIRRPVIREPIDRGKVVLIPRLWYPIIMLMMLDLCASVHVQRPNIGWLFHEWLDWF